jgi:hypothetical protein
MSDGPTEIEDIMDEGEELLTRYAANVSATWSRNLNILAALAVVQVLAQGPETAVNVWLEELGPYFLAAFGMGAYAAMQE